MAAGDLLEVFDRIQHNYLGYIYSASVALDVFIITFHAPEISSFVDMKLFPLIMNVTFKAVKNSGEHKIYLCSSTLYFSLIRRHALILLRSLVARPSEENIDNDEKENGIRSELRIV
ncbi:hypothetical protein BDC45DRAFT_534753 [Circinella umbellata]|nr:hypothetical protein BDC45DRAFT_534753 [Circinella umbellata]